jgi:hypothetical protein
MCAGLAYDHVDPAAAAGGVGKCRAATAGNQGMVPEKMQTFRTRSCTKNNVAEACSE